MTEDILWLSEDVLWHRLRYFLSPQMDIYISLREHLRGQPRVLEAGFGVGAGTMLYADKVGHLTGIEINRDAVEFAKAMYPLENVDWIHADILDFASPKKFSAILAIEVLEHIPEWIDALQNIRSLLVDPGGEFIMSARNANADLRRAKSQHERELTADELVSALEEFFPNVTIYDYTLARIQDRDTRVTPILAVCRT